MLEKHVDLEIREGKEEEFNQIMGFIKKKFKDAEAAGKELKIEIRTAKIEAE